MTDKKSPRSREKWPIVYFFVAALVSIVTPILIFNTLKPILHNPDAWNALGGYFGEIAGPLISRFNLAAVIYIATIVTRFQQEEQRLYEIQERRKPYTYDLRREWNAESMFVQRTRAGKIVIKPNAQTLDKLDAEGPPEETARVWVVLGFYQRLWFAISDDQLDNKLVISLFGDTFYWWYRNCFYGQLQPTGWESWDSIERLWKWLCANASKSELDGWIRRWGPPPSPGQPNPPIPSSQNPKNPKPQS